MATSDVVIINNALFLIGAKPITSLTEGTDRANFYASMFPMTRDAVTRAHPWRFARKLFDTIAEVSPAPKWKWSHAYNLSSDPYVLRVLEVDGDREGRQWNIYGRQILTNLGSPINYEALIRVTATLDFDALFEDALTFRLAAAGALPFTESRTIMEAMMVAYADKVKEARTISSQEGYPDDADAGSPLLTARLAAGDASTWRKIKSV